MWMSKVKAQRHAGPTYVRLFDPRIMSGSKPQVVRQCLDVGSTHMEEGIGSSGNNDNSIGSAEGAVGNETSIGDLASLAGAGAAITAGGFVGGTTGAAMGAISASQNGNVQAAGNHIGADVVNGMAVTGELAARDAGAFGLFEASSVSVGDFASSDGGAGAGITYNSDGTIGAGAADPYAAWGGYWQYMGIYSGGGVGGSEGGGGS